MELYDWSSPPYLDYPSTTDYHSSLDDLVASAKKGLPIGVISFFQLRLCCVNVCYQFRFKFFPKDPYTRNSASRQEQDPKQEKEYDDSSEAYVSSYQSG